MTEWWSWGLAALALSSTWLIGEKKTWAWLFGAGQQLLWMIYAVATKQWGFLASAGVFLVINMRNYAKWRREEVAAREV